MVAICDGQFEVRQQEMTAVKKELELGKERKVYNRKRINYIN